MVDDRTLENLTRDQLIALADARGVEVPKKPTKPQLIKLLRAAKAAK